MAPAGPGGAWACAALRGLVRGAWSGRLRDTPYLISRNSVTRLCSHPRRTHHMLLEQIAEFRFRTPAKSTPAPPGRPKLRVLGSRLCFLGRLLEGFAPNFFCVSASARQSRA